MRREDFFKGIPNQTQKKLRRECWRLNRRFWPIWMGIAGMVLFPVAGMVTSALLIRHKRQSMSSLIVTAVCMVAAFLAARLVLQLFAEPIAKKNYHAVLFANQICPMCHYDLRATPTRCPECGAVPLES